MQCVNAIIINTDQVFSSGTQTYTGNIELGNDVTISTAQPGTGAIGGAGDLTFTGSINSDATGTGAGTRHNLTLISGTGTITFGDDAGDDNVGGSTALNYLVINTADNGDRPAEVLQNSNAPITAAGLFVQDATLVNFNNTISTDNQLTNYGGLLTGNLNGVDINGTTIKPAVSHLPPRHHCPNT